MSNKIIDFIYSSSLDRLKFWDIELNEWYENSHKLFINNNGEIYNSETDEIETNKFKTSKYTRMKDSNKKEIFEHDVILYEDDIYFIEGGNNGMELVCINNLNENFGENENENYSYFHRDNLFEIRLNSEILIIGNLFNLNKIKEIDKDFLKILNNQ